MGLPVGGDRVNPRMAEGLAVVASGAVGVAEVVALVAVDLAAVVERLEARWAGLRAVVCLDAEAAECRGLLRGWVGRRADWAVLAACPARLREWGVGPEWAVTLRE